MSPFSITIFTGAKGEDAVLFIKIIEANSSRMEKDFAQEERESSKCLLLITNTGGKASEWINRQSQDHQESWARLTGGLRARFPLQEFLRIHRQNNCNIKDNTVDIRTQPHSKAHVWRLASAC